MLQLNVNPDLSGATMQRSKRVLSVRRTRILGLYRVTEQATGEEFCANFFERKNGQSWSHCTCRKRDGGLCSHLSLAACFHVLVTASKRRRRGQ